MRRGLRDAVHVRRRASTRHARRARFAHAPTPPDDPPPAVAAHSQKNVSRAPEIERVDRIYHSPKARVAGRTPHRGRTKEERGRERAKSLEAVRSSPFCFCVVFGGVVCVFVMFEQLRDVCLVCVNVAAKLLSRGRGRPLQLMQSASFCANAVSCHQSSCSVTKIGQPHHTAIPTQHPSKE